MYKLIFFLFIFFVIASSSFAQKIRVNVSMRNIFNHENSDTIYYSVNRNLTWSDFKGIPDNNHFGGAVTASGFAYDAEMNMFENEINLNIWVYIFFNKRSSWKKPNINSGYHLLHEQLILYYNRFFVHCGVPFVFLSKLLPAETELMY